MKRLLFFLAVAGICLSPLYAQSIPLSFSETLSMGGFGGTTIQGATGTIVVPSAEPVWNEQGAALSTGYSLLYSSEGITHIPYVKVGFNRDLEAHASLDINSSGLDLLLGGKWRFDHRNNNSMAVGINSQLLEMFASNATDISYAVQFYYVSTFGGMFIDWPAKITLLLGYTLDEDPNSDIDFGMGFQTPFFEDIFNDKMVFLIDFGNVSYSKSPSAGNAHNRGLINVGIRLLPIQLGRSIAISSDLRALDLLDDTGRAVSLAMNISLTR
jgi:hypothetical protein